MHVYSFITRMSQRLVQLEEGSAANSFVRHLLESTRRSDPDEAQVSERDFIGVAGMMCRAYNSTSSLGDTLKLARRCRWSRDNSHVITWLYAGNDSIPRGSEESARGDRPCGGSRTPALHGRVYTRSPFRYSIY